MSEDTPVKRGRGRPPGALNKKTLAKQQEMEEKTTLDVAFEEPGEVEEVLEPVVEEPEEVEEPEPDQGDDELDIEIPSMAKLKES